MSNTRQDIKLMQANAKGNDFIIGDVHSNLESLIEVLKQLGDNDRLFIVGDLTDKRRKNFEVIDLLQSAKFKDRVFAVRGNHEDILINHISSLEKLIQIRLESGINLESIINDINVLYLEYLIPLSKQLVSNPKLLEDPIISLNHFSKWVAEDILHSKKAESHDIIKNIFLHLCNSGIWLFEEFIKELSEKTIRITCDEEKNYHMTHKDDSKVYKAYGNAYRLPYIIHVQGDAVSFSIVHADMPFDNNELLHRIQANETLLSDKDKIYCTWVREGAEVMDTNDVGFRPIKNSEGKLIFTYVGHAPVDHARLIREASNSVNLDGKAHQQGVFLAVKHTGGKMPECLLLGVQYPNITNLKNFEVWCAGINKYFNDKCKPAAEIDHARSSSTFFASESAQSSQNARSEEYKNQGPRKSL